MNTVFVGVITAGLALLILNNPDIAFSTMLNGSEKAITLCLKLWAIYALWLGLLKIIEATDLDKKIAKLLSPIINFLIGQTDKNTKNQIAINLTSNILGMGNACMPSAINSLKGLDKGSKYITNAMAMFMILNVTSLQLIPTTIIGLRVTHNSNSPSSIILPCLIATLASTLTGVILVKIISKFRKDKY